jgi:hypothetical protein
MQSNGSWDYELEGYEECKKVKPFFAVEDGYRNIVVIFEKYASHHSGRKSGKWAVSLASGQRLSSGSKCEPTSAGSTSHVESRTSSPCVDY